VKTSSAAVENVCSEFIDSFEHHCLLPEMFSLSCLNIDVSECTQKKHMRLRITNSRLFSSGLTKEQIHARQATLDMIDRPVFGAPSHALQRKILDSSYFLERHPDQETALKIRAQMEEIALLIEKQNAREQSGNRLIVFAASSFIVTTMAYMLFQLSDVNTVFTSSLPSLFTLFEFSTARRILCSLARLDILPVDFGSEDPYLIRTMDCSKLHPKSRPVRVCVPIGLDSGIDVDSDGPASFLKLGFGYVDVGPVYTEARPSCLCDNLQIIGSSVVSDAERCDGSSGIQSVADRFCRYLEHRTDDLLTRNCVAGMTIVIQKSSDIDTVFAHRGLMSLADILSFDVSRMTSNEIVEVIKRADKLSQGRESIPLLFLKIGLKQCFPPPEEVVGRILKSQAVVGVNVCGSALAEYDPRITRFTTKGLMHIRGNPVRERSTQAVSNWFLAMGGRISQKQVISSGGVFSGADALEKIEAGASIVNVFSAFVLDGPPVARRIKTQLSVRLMNKGYYDLDEVIGSKHRLLSKRLRDAQKNRRRF
jgi:dihydroorotate dehydrogenase